MGAVRPMGNWDAMQCVTALAHREDTYFNLADYHREMICAVILKTCGEILIEQKYAAYDRRRFEDALRRVAMIEHVCKTLIGEPVQGCDLPPALQTVAEGY